MTVNPDHHVEWDTRGLEQDDLLYLAHLTLSQSFGTPTRCVHRLAHVDGEHRL